jgi:hypothetical protein
VLTSDRYHGLASVKEAFELASKTLDEDGNLVLKVLVEM